MVEEMYLEEAKENENNMASSEGGNDRDQDVSLQDVPQNTDQKPTPDRLLRIDSDSVSSIINNNSPADHKQDPRSSKTLQNHHHINMNPREQCLGRVTDAYGSAELDFSSYTNHSSGMVSYTTGINDHQNANQSFNGGGGGGGGGGVSLTLGLQQQGGSGVSLAFPPATQGSLFYPRDQIEDCQPVQYSLLDGEGQNLPYRNLMGAQLLHDLAG